MVLNNINIKIESPCFVSLIGPSGCGKSTLLNIISLMDSSFEGEYLFLNKNVKNLTEEEKKEYLATQITYLFQEPNFIDEESIKVNLELITHLEINKEKVLLLMKEFNLDKDLDTKCKVLSRGEKKRLMVIGAILRNTSLIICDEITSGLDPLSTKIVMENLKKLSKEKIIIFVTHNVDLANTYSSNVFYFKNHMLPLIHIKEKPLKILEIKKETKLSNKYLFDHARKMIKKKRLRVFILLFSVVICLFTMGLSFLIKDTIESSLRDSLSSYYGTNQIIMKSKEENSALKKMEVVDGNEFEDFISDYDDLIEYSSQTYLCNYENYFIDSNDFLIELNEHSYYLSNYGVRNINEFTLLESSSLKVYPSIEELKDNQIVIALSENKIYEICRILSLSGYKYDSLSKYLINHSIEAKLLLENKEWEYKISIPFEIVGFVISSNSMIYSSNPQFNEMIIEDTMQLPYSYFPLEKDYYPWTTKKYPSLIIKEDNLVTFAKRMLIDEKMNRFSFHLIKEEDTPIFEKGNNKLKQLYLTYKNQDSINLTDIEDICFNQDNMISYIPCGNNSFMVDESALINGFELPTYFSSSEAIINEFIDYNSFSNNNLGKYQSNYFTTNSEDFFSLSMLDCSKENYCRFISYNKNNLELVKGTFPKNDMEVLVSQGLYQKMNLEEENTIYLTSLVSIEQKGNKYQNTFKSISFKVSGVVKDEKFSLYSDNLFPLILSNIHLNIFQEDQNINKCLITLKDNNDEYLNMLNNKYPSFQFINPLKEYLSSIEESLNYLSQGLLIFSLIILVSSLFMMILVNHLFLKDGEKEIVIYSFLGYQKRSIFTYFLIINTFLVLSGTLISLASLFITSLMLPLLDKTITSVYLSVFPFMLIVLVSLVSLVISSLITLRLFLKKDIIELVKN